MVRNIPLLVLFLSTVYSSCEQELCGELIPLNQNMAYPTNHSQKNGFDTFRLMSFNIRYATLLDLQYAWKYRKEIVTTLIEDRGDIVCLQEALHTQITDLSHSLKNYRFVGVGRDDGKEQGEYVPIFYNHRKFKVIEHGHFWLSKTPSVPGSKSWGSKYPRMCTWALFGRKEHKGQASNNNLPKFYVFNTHLDHISEEARIEGTKLILHTIQQKTQDNSMPVFLAGGTKRVFASDISDFNSDLSSPAYQLITKGEHSFTMEDTINTSITGHHGPITTSTGFRFQEEITIDYIFIHTGENQNWTVLTHGVLSDVWENNYPPSDHRPVVCDVLMKW